MTKGGNRSAEVSDKTERDERDSDCKVARDTVTCGCCGLLVVWIGECVRMGNVDEQGVDVSGMYRANQRLAVSVTYEILCPAFANHDCRK